MQLRKLLWHFNLDLKRLTFNKIGIFSYMGPAISLVGQKRISIGNRVRIYPGCRMETHDNGEIIINDDIKGCSFIKFDILCNDSLIPETFFFIILLLNNLLFVFFVFIFLLSKDISILINFFNKA